MPFRPLSVRPAAPENPEKLFLEFTRRQFPTVLPHQSALIASYVASALDRPDVALQLPTGSGKTLVGLLIAEWLLRKNRERVVYLCPTRQLVNQVVEQAADQYGMCVLGFTGSKREYGPSEKTEYQNADKVAITTYSSLFNSDPFFDDPSVILVDDAHAAENYFASMWTVLIDREDNDQIVLHKALTGVLHRILEPSTYTRIIGERDGDDRGTWVDKVPSPDFLSIMDEVMEIMDVHADDARLYFQWQAIRPILHACSMYLSRNSILIRPLISPTWTHKPFTQARQRIYMSATLGAGGDLERLTGRKSILRLPLPKDFPTQAVGRRFFIFPEMAMDEAEARTLRSGLMKLTARSLVLVPSDRAAAAVTEQIKTDLGYPVFSAKDIEQSKKPFISSTPAVAVVSGRYDGIDFPNNECRLLFLDGLPKATNLQEQFIMSRMGANTLYNERVMSRILQAVGRCTRSLLDYSAVVLSGGELPSYLANPKQRSYFSVELQAEIEFGIAQSKQTSVADLLDNFSMFIANGPEWQQANDQIIRQQAHLSQQEFPALKELETVAPIEIDFQTHLCEKDFDAALEAAERILGHLNHPKLQGYRALWHYYAGVAAHLASPDGSGPMGQNARNHFREAKKAAPIHWLSSLAKFQGPGEEAQEDNTPLLLQIERLEENLEKLGALHEGRFAKLEKEILEGLHSLTPEDSTPFETAHVELGKLLGFSAGRVQDNGSPDPWWLLKGHLCFVFEDHAGGKEDGCLNTSKARQAMAHPDWIRANVPDGAGGDIVSVVVTPATRADQGAKPILHHFCVWPLNDFIPWAEKAITVVRTLRAKFPGSGDLVWRAEAMDLLKAERLDVNSIKELVCARPADKYFQ